METSSKRSLVLCQKLSLKQPRHRSSCPRSNATFLICDEIARSYNVRVKNKITLFVGLTLYLLGALRADPVTPSVPVKEFTWQNPLPVGTSGLDGLRDPFILKEGDTWYMTGTGKPFFTTDYPKMGNPKGVPLYSSPDLKTWKFEGTLVPRIEGSWYQDNFWAPEIHAKDTPAGRKFYCTFNGFNEITKKGGVGLAVADKITGPYTVLTPDAPIISGNDADLFTDTNGQDYLFRSGVVCCKIDLEHAKVIGEPWGCFGGGAPEDWDTGPGIGHEGPQVIKIADTYYCFYSSWGRGYEVGYATAKDLHGPWTKSPDNPIYGAQNEAACKRYHKVYTQAAEVPFVEVGHGQPFIGPDGKWWISAHFGQTRRPPGATGYHGWEQPGYDPLVFENGAFKRVQPSWTPQTVTLPPP